MDSFMYVCMYVKIARYFSCNSECSVGEGLPEFRLVVVACKEKTKGKEMKWPALLLALFVIVVFLLLITTVSLFFSYSLTLFSNSYPLPSLIHHTIYSTLFQHHFGWMAPSDERTSCLVYKNSTIRGEALSLSTSPIVQQSNCCQDIQFEHCVQEIT